MATITTPSLTLRNTKGSPLTSTEVDNNFSNISTALGTGLTAASYTAADVLAKLITVDGLNSGLDADLIRGAAPSSANVISTVVTRDASGNFSANIITATSLAGTHTGVASFTSGTLSGITSFASNSVSITGGSITGTTIGATTPSTGGFTSITDSGNLTFTGTSNRITGDMSNATEANRVALQSSTTNGNTIVPLYPNGTGTLAGLSTPTVPMVFYTNGNERMRIDTAGNVGINTITPTSTGVNSRYITVNSPTGTGTQSGLSSKVNNVEQGYVYGDGAIFNVESATGLPLRLWTPPSQPIIFATNYTERMRIGDLGQLGIGAANYGTSGQVLTSGGALAAPTWSAVSGFAAGTRMSFQQTAAPTGWTKDTTAALNDSIMRIVTGTIGSGGTTAFSTFNAANPSTGATTLSTAQMPSHTHTFVVGGSIVSGVSDTASGSTVRTTSATGGGGSHTHPGDGAPAIKYYDFIIASKD